MVKQRHVTGRLLVETLADGRHLIFNPLSGAVDVADEEGLERIEKLKRGEPIALTADDELQLRSRHYLFDSPADEEAYLECLVSDAWWRMQSGQPQVYTICPTLACNLACGYCFEGDSLTDKKQGVLTDSQVALLFDAIASIRKQFASAGQSDCYAPLIALFGGEPFLPSTRRPLEQIFDRAFDGGFVVGATTNGVNLLRFEGLLSEYVDILAGFQITLDGPKEVHDARRHRLGGQGTFDEIVGGIDLLLSLGVTVDLRVNLDIANIQSLPQLAGFVHEKGWDTAPGFRLALAGVTHHSERGACQNTRSQALTELELAQTVIAMMDSHPEMEKMIHLGFLRHLEHLVYVLEPERYQIGGRTRGVGPRFWYCEASTDKQYVFTPEGFIYNCTESVGNPRHAVGRFDPELTLWQKERSEWVGRTILSHPKCRACSISTLCGGGCHMAAREHSGSSAENLIQITVGQRSTNLSVGDHSVDPFCGMAEETVRAYLRYAGSHIPK
jgi:uncharacterized protein